MKTAAFTLVELLVVITVLAVLAALGFSVTGVATQKMHSTKCLNSLRQIGVAMQVYAGENDGRLPDTGHLRAEDGTSHSWIHTLSPYLGPGLIGRCPANTISRAAVTYGWNDLLADSSGQGLPIRRVRTPASTLVVGEASDTYTSEHFHFAGARTRVTYNQFKSAVGVERHGTGANYLFADGHIETLTPTETKNRLSAAESAFLEP